MSIFGGEITLSAMHFINNTAIILEDFPSLRQNIYISGGELTMEDIYSDTDISCFVYVDKDVETSIIGLVSPLFIPKLESVSPSYLSQEKTNTTFEFVGEYFMPCGLVLNVYRDDLLVRVCAC
jgi:hypothetical protein